MLPFCAQNKERNKDVYLHLHWCCQERGQIELFGHSIADALAPTGTRVDERFNVTLYATRCKGTDDPVVACGEHPSGQPRHLHYERKRPNWDQVLQELQDKASSGNHRFCVFVCGPAPMVDALAVKTRERNIAFHAETFEF